MNEKPDIALPQEGLNLAIIGWGKMGQLHQRAFQSIASANLVGIIEIDPARKAMIDNEGLKSVDSLDEFPIRPEAAVIATPAETHADVAVPLLRAGIHCLIEKPFALTRKEADALTQAADTGNAMVAVGHCERFNEQIASALNHLGDEALAVEVTRYSVPRPPLPQIDVIHDLMVHDLDWILRHECKLPDRIRIDSLDFNRSESPREVHCILTFGHRTYTLHASHIRPTKIRNIKIESKGKNPLNFDLSPIHEPSKPDALQRQAKSFLDLCKGKRSTIATGSQALEILTCVEEIRRLCLQPSSALEME